MNLIFSMHRGHLIQFNATTLLWHLRRLPLTQPHLPSFSYSRPLIIVSRAAYSYRGPDDDAHLVSGTNDEPRVPGIFGTNNVAASQQTHRMTT